MLKAYTVNPCPLWGICFLKVMLSVDLHWMNLILRGINGDKGTQPWKVKVINCHKHTKMIFIHEVDV